MIAFPRLTEKEFREAQSETARYRYRTAPYCQRDDGKPGCGVDLASQGDTVVPWAVSFDLPVGEFNYYNSNHPAKGPIHLRGHAETLPFETGSLDFVHASHILEDYAQSRWPEVLGEWARVVRPGGHVIILVPEVKLWAEAIANGQCPNCSHSAPEPSVGDISKVATALGLEIVKEELTNEYPGDYSIIAILRVPSANT